MRRLSMVILLAALTAAPAFADPGITVDYRDGSLRVTLAGSYAGTFYQVWRSGEMVGEYDPVFAQRTLCTADCFLADHEAIPGETYFYRFELYPPEGGLVSYGPYPVTVPNTPIAASIRPNPSNGAAQLQLSIPGHRRLDSPLRVDARLIDIQGRTVRRVYAGELQRGVTSLAWDGRDDAGTPLDAGIYFLRMATPIGNSITRIVRFR